MATKTKTKPAAEPADDQKRVFKWRGGGGFGASAQEVGEELLRLEVKPGEFHRTPEVLDAARDPDSPLHKCFEWDDSKAAEQHRLHQCRNMMRSIAEVIVRGEHREKRPMYVHIRDTDGPKYVRASQVASDAQTRQRALDEVLSLLNGLRKRFEYLSELTPLFEEIHNLNKRRKGAKKAK